MASLPGATNVHLAAGGGWSEFVGQQESWSSYLGDFHSERAGITERVLRRCRAAGADPYQWLAAQVPSSSRTVDLACGSAPLYRELGASHDYLGVDSSAAELSLAAQRGAPVVLADATRLPLGAGTVDAVVCSMALMLLSVAATLNEAARVLRPGGHFVAMVPASAPLSARDRVTYARLLLALRRVGFHYPDAAAVSALAAGRSVSSLRVISDENRRFAYPLEPGAGELLLESLYLPGVSGSARSRARRLVSRWTAGELGVPLRLLVMRKGC